MKAFAPAMLIILASILAAPAAADESVEKCGQELVTLVAELEAYGNLNSSTEGRDVHNQLGESATYTLCRMQPGQDGTSSSSTYFVSLHEDDVTIFITSIANDTGVSKVYGPFHRKHHKQVPQEAYDCVNEAQQLVGGKIDPPSGKSPYAAAIDKMEECEKIHPGITRPHDW